MTGVLASLRAMREYGAGLKVAIAAATIGIIYGYDLGNISGALLFSCNGRGRGLFGRGDHDAVALDEALAGAPAAGFFAAGEIGPVGGESFLHGFTATVAGFA